MRGPSGSFFPLINRYDCRVSAVLMKVTKLIAAHNDSGGSFVKHMAEWGVLAGELQEILEDLKRLSSWDNDKARESLNCAALQNEIIALYSNSTNLEMVARTVEVKERLPQPMALLHSSSPPKMKKFKKSD